MCPECSDSLSLHLFFVCWSQRDAHTHVEWCQKCCCDLSLTPTVSDIIHSSSQGLTSSTETHKVCLSRTQSSPIIRLLLDGPVCRWISACLTHSSSVWAPPPLNLLCFSCRLSLLPSLACVCLNHCGSDVGMGKPWWQEETRVIPVFWDFSNICQGFPTSTNVIFLSLTVEAPLTESGHECAMVAMTPGKTATEHANRREWQIWAVHLWRFKMHVIFLSAWIYNPREMCTS